MFPDIEHVFIPVDFSRSSRAAVELARAFSSRHAISLELAHAIDPLPPYVREILFPFAGMGEDSVELEHELCQRAIDAMVSTYELDTSRDDQLLPHARVGVRNEVLTEALGKSNAQMVIMGAFGQSGAHPESIGSTAAQMLGATTRPVLLTRSLSERVPKITRVLCALDLSPSSAEVLEWAFNVAVTTGAELETVFVLPDPLYQNPNNILTTHVRFQADKVLERERHKIEALFERAFKALELPFADKEKIHKLWRRREILSGEPAAAILDRADAIDADLIVIGTRSLQSPSTSRLGHIAWRITRACTTHLLAVPIAREVNLLDAEE